MFFLYVKGVRYFETPGEIILILDVRAQKTLTLKIRTVEITNLAILGERKQSSENRGSELIQLFTRSLAG
jgi:hypothetical protein